MAVVGRSSSGILQKKAANRWTFGAAKRTRFLDALATTCNVRFAAKHAGIDPTTASALRRRDGEFARLWAAAIELGQERLKEELVACALGQAGAGNENPGDERAVVHHAPFDPDLAIRVLQLQARIAPRGRSAARAAPEPSAREVYAVLAQRLDEAEARVARRAALAIEAPVVDDAPSEGR